LARVLQAGRTADEIALALVGMHRARLPAPEDLADAVEPAWRDDRSNGGRKTHPAPGRVRGGR
jgi:ATP-dependent RNA helicase DeaD